jgi:ubiquinone biosynthesis protein COQ9
MSIRIGADLANSFNSVFRGATDTIEKLQSRISQMQASSRIILPNGREQIVGDVRQIEAAQGALNRLTAAQSRVAATRQVLANAAGDIISAAWPVAMLAGPVKTAAAFEQAMARVAAVSGATGESFDALAKQARDLGRDTQFTAMQAAGAQENLARAGLRTEEIIAAMPGLLNMAAA